MQHIEKITIDQLAAILHNEGGAIAETIDYGGMLAHVIDHPTRGRLTTIQASDDNILLIKGL